MRFNDVVVPFDAAWSSPFARWQGPLADINSLELARQVTARALRDRGVEWPVEELVLGWTVPQKELFYGAPTLAAALGFGDISGPMVSQACATSVASLHVAAANQDRAEGGARLVVTTDRTSNGPQLVYPSQFRPGGASDIEHWVIDNFNCDPNTGDSMLATAERVAGEAGITKEELDELTIHRWEQYEEALADDRAFQREWMIPVEAGSRSKPIEVDADWGVRPVTPEGAGALTPVLDGGVVTYATQTHPADGTAGMIVTSTAQARELGVDGPLVRVLATGFARVAPARMPKAPVPAAVNALRDAELDFGQIDIVKTHNPFAVNDLWFARETGVDVDAMNPYGCSLIYGHPQGPTGARGIVELLHALKRRGGGIGLFTGCAAGDTGGAVVVELRD